MCRFSVREQRNARDERHDALDDEQVFMDALEAGAEDVDLEQEDIIEITTPPTEFAAVRDALASTYEFAAQELGPIPLTWVELEDEEMIANMTKLIDLLEDNDDVQDVYHNWLARMTHSDDIRLAQTTT